MEGPRGARLATAKDCTGVGEAKPNAEYDDESLTESRTDGHPEIILSTDAILLTR